MDYCTFFFNGFYLNNFLKNQTRPIINLAKASEKFGRGEDVEDFRPSGALEIRQAGYEFDKMRKRIIKTSKSKI